MRGVKIISSLLLYEIQCQNADLIHFLEDEKKVEEESYEECFMESIKCNHNGFADYFLNNCLQDGVQLQYDTFFQSLKHNSFVFIQKEQVNKSSF
ncbi:hypothetical protein M9Y10_007193 [Tritrichomonas musculus]|uniref:Uncharacterized protein n=1 Tax=Tritrichomonas musculus TaxID=1915356 RepID=A0ABR2J0X3_9EUKA